MKEIICKKCLRSFIDCESLKNRQISLVDDKPLVSTFSVT